MSDSRTSEIPSARYPWDLLHIWFNLIIIIFGIRIHDYDSTPVVEMVFKFDITFFKTWSIYPH